ncbi:MAG: TldD/PmbA family protein [Candidatus Aenigmatarchaeota archaeon]
MIENLNFSQENKKEIKKSSEACNQIYEYLRKYEVEAKKERGEPLYLSASMYAVTSIEVSVLNGERVNNYNSSLQNKTIVTAHYKPAKPIFYVENEIFSKDMLWKAELQAWENYGNYRHSRFEEKEFNLLQPERSIKDNIKMNEFDENDALEIMKNLDYISREAKEKVDRVLYNLSLKDIKFSFVDVAGSEIIQELNYWYVIFVVRKKANQYPLRHFELSYSIGASEVKKSFNKLFKTLYEGVMNTVNKVELFSKNSSNPSEFTLSSGNYKAILDGRVAGVALHEFGAGHLAEAHRVIEEGEALTFYGKIGKRISTHHVTLIDDGTLEIEGIKPISYYLYDAEGVRKKSVEIIKDGRFNSYLHSKLTAGTLSEEEGGGFLTGNARIEVENETKTPIVPRMSTLYLKPRDLSFDELLEMAKGGILITSGSPSGEVLTQLAVGWMPIDEMYYIDHNKDIKPLIYPQYNVYIRETPESFLKKIKGVGNKKTLTFDVGFCGAESGFIPHAIYSPAVFVNRVCIILSKGMSFLREPLVKQ